ncbi:MAG: lacZ 3 [Chitinophagaceae bacterium]|nr:lacZ 3 [Chitinophagaceae bacterium]
MRIKHGLIIFVFLPFLSEAQLTTQWTSQVTPANAHREYPRPQMVRDEWQNLNGLWDYAITPEQDEKVTNWQGKILVPYPVESLLSGVKKAVGPINKLWYHKTFTVPAAWKNKHVLLHFEAVDWETKVSVNGRELGIHQGGYDAFSFDITSALKNSGDQHIVVSVWDPSNAGYQPQGKQWNNPRSIWYTATTGIWQTAWLEPVNEVSITDFKLVPDIHTKTLHISLANAEQYKGYTVQATAYDKGKKLSEASGTANSTDLRLTDVKLWSPDQPFLYDLTLTLLKDGKKTDAVKSYFGMRSISLGKDAMGVQRLLLNDQPLFQYGPLDQGFWPDGLYTAPTDEALRYDIEVEKKVGFNMIRKHVKVEPKRWYYWCDKLGILVWQDMPSGDRHIGGRDTDIVRTAQSSHQYKKELHQMIDQHYNSPAIVTWVPFNEGWGQFATGQIADFVKQWDPTRLVNSVSGWTDRGVGDMHDIHNYPKPAMPPLEANRAAILGEFGGQALVVKDHLWNNDLSLAPNHIQTSLTSDQLWQTYSSFIDSVYMLKKKGLAAAVYTQTTDVEMEVNGILTYDRRILKMDADKLKRIHTRLIKD